MKWWYWIIVAIIIAAIIVAYFQFGHAQGFPSPSPTAFNRSSQPFWSPTATPTPAKMQPPPPMK